MKHGKQKVSSPLVGPSCDTQNLVLSELSLLNPSQNFENKIQGLQYIGARLQYIGAPSSSWLFGCKGLFEPIYLHYFPPNRPRAEVSCNMSAQEVLSPGKFLSERSEVGNCKFTHFCISSPSGSPNLLLLPTESYNRVQILRWNSFRERRICGSNKFISGTEARRSAQ